MNSESSLFVDELKEYLEGFYADSTTHPGIFDGRTSCADSVWPGMNTVTPRGQFKPIRLWGNLVVNYNGR